MELRTYWNIIVKRLWLILVLMALFLLSYFLLAHQAPPSYTATMRFVVGIKPEAVTGGYYTYDRYYTWLTAEYLLDDLAEVVKSRAFAADVATMAGTNIPAGVIQGSTSAGKLHRILTVTMTWGNPDELARLADALTRVLRERGATYFAQLSTENAVISVIDPPAIGPVGASLRQRLDLPLRLLLALVLGIALTFLLDYLDDTIRHRGDLDSLGLPVLGEIPTRRHTLVRLRRRSMP